MKKLGGALIVGACLVFGLFYFKTSSSRESSPGNSSPGQTDARPAEIEQSAPGGHARTWTRATKGDASTGNDPNTHLVVQQKKDFTSGDMQNVVVDGVMQMGNDGSFLCRTRPDFRYFGVFVSGEGIAAAPFDTVVPGMAFDPGSEGEVTLEFRTRRADSDWTIWEEVTPPKMNQPFSLESESIAWQYRVTFYANNPPRGPQVQNVTMATRKVGNTAVAAVAETISADNAQ